MLSLNWVTQGDPRRHRYLTLGTKRAIQGVWSTELSRVAFEEDSKLSCHRLPLRITGTVYPIRESLRCQGQLVSGAGDKEEQVTPLGLLPGVHTSRPLGRGGEGFHF